MAAGGDSRDQRRSGSAGAAQHSAVPLAVASAAGLRHDPLRLSALLLHERRSAAPELAEAGGEGTRGEVVKQLEKILFDQYRDPHLAVKPKALEGRGGQYYSEAACELMNAIYNDKRIIMHVNTRNNGAINGLPDDCAVEVSSLITASGPLPLNVAPFPEDTLRLLQLMKSFERLTIEAALTGNRHTAWRALMLNPLIVSGEKLELALDEVIAENRQWLPAFHA